MALPCTGRKNIWDTHDSPDSIEGNKLRNRVKCPKCKGTGEGAKKAVVASIKSSLQYGKKKWKNIINRIIGLRNLKNN